MNEASRLRVAPTLAERIDDLLPQTQCARCGFAGCRPYADAIAAGSAPINRCPPGGEATVTALARLLGCEPIALDATRGTPGPRRIARIDESACIGCTLCIQACPVDAIVGAPKRLHGVLSALCSGCELCLPPCPVDCISLHAAGDWTTAERGAARERFERRGRRLEAARTTVRGERLGQAPAPGAATPRLDPRARDRQAAIAAALERARARRRAPRTPS
jgi:electron transport complex protein RnfB